MTAALAHVAAWTDADGSPCLATLTPWRADDAVRRYVQAVKALPPALRRWSDDLRAWIVGADAGPELRAILAAVYGADVCASCAAGDPCAAWRPLDALARRLELGGLAAGDATPAPVPAVLPAVLRLAPTAGDADPPADVIAAAARLHLAADAPPELVRAAADALTALDPADAGALLDARDRLLAWWLARPAAPDHATLRARACAEGAPPSERPNACPPKHPRKPPTTWRDVADQLARRRNRKPPGGAA